MDWLRYSGRALCVCASLALASCNDDSDNSPDTPPAQTAQVLQTSGTLWIRPDGRQIVLKGTNLGNWLLNESWMMGQSHVPDQCTLESTLTSRFSTLENERLMDLFRDNWISGRDWDSMAEFGLNVVRVPFSYTLLEDDSNPKQLRPDAWQYLDHAVQQAEARGMYVILDLHGAAGSQGREHHSGCAGRNWFWDGGNGQPAAYYQDRTTWLWQQIAQRYRGRGSVAAYGLLNEPWGTDAQALAGYIKQLYAAIRAVDPDHIVILPGHNSGIGAYGNPADAGMTNVAFEMHFYPGIFGWGQIGYGVHRDWLLCGPTGTTGVCEWRDRLKSLNTPFLIGEMQPWTGQGDLGGEITRATYDRYGSFGWATTSWSYKVFTNGGGQGAGTWGMVTNADPLPDLDFATASLTEIEALFRSFGTTSYDVHLDLKRWLTSSAPPELLRKIPAAPTGLTLTNNGASAQLVWNASSEADLTGYSVYRATVLGAYSLLASGVTTPAYTDNTLVEGLPYFYVVAATDKDGDESFLSDPVHIEGKPVVLPGTIEAEYFVAMSGVQTETTTDVGGGLNVGFLDPGDWFEYRVNVQAAGNYQVEYRVASETGSAGGFELLVNGAVVDSQSIAATGGWQAWTTITALVVLQAGEQTLRFSAVGGGWNLNKITFTSMEGMP